MIFPTLSRWGSLEPFSMSIAWRMRTAAGGVFVMKVKERSSKTVISTGIVDAHVVRRLGVERLDELHDVDAVLTQRRADRRCR